MPKNGIARHTPEKSKCRVKIVFLTWEDEWFKLVLSDGNRWFCDPTLLDCLHWTKWRGGIRIDIPRHQNCMSVKINLLPPSFLIIFAQCYFRVPVEFQRDQQSNGFLLRHRPNPPLPSISTARRSWVFYSMSTSVRGMTEAEERTDRQETRERGLELRVYITK